MLPAKDMRCDVAVLLSITNLTPCCGALKRRLGHVASSATVQLDSDMPGA
jgi:hypothetical protein